MQATLLVITIVLALIMGGSLWWRRASRRRSLPCPAWLAVLLENPFVEIVTRNLGSLDIIDLHPGMRVLDVGCGPGRLSIPMAKRVGPTGEIVALDIQPAMLQILKQRMEGVGVTNISSMLGGIGEVKLDRDAFDRALLVTVLGEIPDRQSALRAIFAALKPGGILSIQELFLDPHYQSRSTVRRLAESAGFRTGNQTGTWFAFAMNFTKPDPASDL